MVEPNPGRPPASFQVMTLATNGPTASSWESHRTWTEGFGNTVMSGIQQSTLQNLGWHDGSGWRLHPASQSEEQSSVFIIWRLSTDVGGQGGLPGQQKGLPDPQLSGF